MLQDKQTNIFRDLAILIETGLPILDAAKRVAASQSKVTTWTKVIQQLNKGKKLNLALAQNNLISRFEQEIISVAEFSGRLPQGLNLISNSVDKRSSRVSQFKSKLYFPIAVLLVAIFVSAILTFINQPEESLLSVLTTSVIYLALTFFLTKKLLSIVSKDLSDWLKLANQFSHSRCYQLLFEQVVFGALLWQIKSAIDFKTAFIRISQLIDNKKLKQKLKHASQYCSLGKSLTQSIIQAKLPITDEFKQVITTAEKSGQYEFSVEKYLQQQSILLDIKTNNLFEWLPRFYYALVVLLAISVIL